MIIRPDRPIVRRRLPQDSRVVSGLSLRNPRSNSSDRLPSFQDSRLSSRPSSVLRNSQLGASGFPRKSLDLRQSQLKQSNFEESKVADLPIQQQISRLFEKYSSKSYIVGMISYYQRKWQQDCERLLREQKYNSLARLLMQRTTLFSPLLQDFLTLDYLVFSQSQRKLLTSLHYKQYLKLTHDLESVTRSILSKIPDEKLIRQQQQLFELYRTLLRMYDVKNNSSQEKMKENIVFYGETYGRRKSELLASVSQKMRPMTDVMVEVEKYFTIYQRDITRLQNNVKSLEKQLEKTKVLLEQKPLYTPIEVDYLKIKEIRDGQKKEIFEDFEGNIVKYYGHRVEHYETLIKMKDQRIAELEGEVRAREETISDLKVEINRLINQKPTMVDAQTQLFYVASKKSLQSISQATGNAYETFLQNVNTPFQFSRVSTSCIINIFLVDKILYDYELIRNKAELKPFRLFLYEWFVLKSGSKKVAQILCKNFVLSLAEMRRDNKRYHLFSKLAGLLKPRGKNLLEDLDLLFHQTQLAWYYYLKIALAYRRKLNQNPSGYPLVPPTNCQQITRLSLRKTYQLIDQFFQSQGLQRPQDLHSKVDLYSINQITRFKLRDQRFQKQQLQQIHILREITFDIICGFLMEHVSTHKCSQVEKFLRGLQVRQREKRGPLTYSDFEGIYKRFYREKRSKIELVFARFCLTNQNNVLDVDNVRSLVVMLVEDQTKIRTVFEKIDSLKLLIFSEKAAIKWMEKRTSHPNSFENFRDRYFMDFFDFFHSTSLLADLYQSVKPLVRKCIMNQSGRERDLDIDDTEPTQQQQQKRAQKPAQQGQNPEPKQQQQEKQQPSKQQTLQQDLTLLQRKVQQFKTIFGKVPKFSKRVITIDQILIHNMRRKDCIDATEYTWKVLRQILMILADRSDLL